MIQTQRLRRKVRNLVSGYPSIYLPMASRFSIGEPVTRDTEIVIEGFPRSANSFAEAAFRVSQAHPMKIAHHCHAAAQVIAATRWHIPCLVIVRNPEDACRSLLMHHRSYFSVGDVFREYNRFHSHIKPYRNGFVLARFDSVIHGFGDVVETVNGRFQTQFVVPQADISKAALMEVDRLSFERGTASSEGEAYSLKRTAHERRIREREMEEMERKIAEAYGEEFFLIARSLYKELEKHADL